MVYGIGIMRLFELKKNSLTSANSIPVKLIGGTSFTIRLFNNILLICRAVVNKANVPFL